LRFLLDENVPRRLKILLENRGYNVAVVFPGESNSSILMKCLKERRILITMDRDFIFHIPKHMECVKRIVILAPSRKWLDAVAFVLKSLDLIKEAFKITNLIVIKHRSITIMIPQGFVIEFE